MPIARATYHLPYSHSRITLIRDGDAITFASRRTAAQAPPATFAGTYRPSSPVFQAAPGSLEHWLVERYRILPYLLSAADDAARTGAPVLRPLVWQFQDDPAVADLGDEAMLGPALLVAPVLAQGAQTRRVFSRSEATAYAANPRRAGASSRRVSATRSPVQL